MEKRILRNSILRFLVAGILFAAGREHFRRMMEERRQRDEPGEWKALRRGWCLGAEQFRLKLLKQMNEKIGAHHGGNERIETAKAKAERIVAEEMARRGWNGAELEQRRKADAGKIKIAGRLRAETTMTWGWIAKRLAMGTSGYTADSLRKT